MKTTTPREQSERQKLIGFWITEIRDAISEKDFQWEFFDSLAEQFERRKDLSDRQVDCLWRIYERVTEQ